LVVPLDRGVGVAGGECLQYKFTPPSSKGGFTTLFDPHGGRPASAGLGALRNRGHRNGDQFDATAWVPAVDSSIDGLSGLEGVVAFGVIDVDPFPGRQHVGRRRVLLLREPTVEFVSAQRGDPTKHTQSIHGVSLDQGRTCCFNKPRSPVPALVQFQSITPALENCWAKAKIVTRPLEPNIKFPLLTGPP